MAKACPVCGVTYPDALSFCPADGSTLRGEEKRANLVGGVIADRYIVTEVLGEGGMGTVYLARHVRLPQLSAIKMLKKEMVEDPAAIARFNREAANASRIDHDRVARVYDYGETADGSVYLAMEYVPGKTLKTLMDEGAGTLEPRRAAALVKQIGEGLDAAHRMSIVHRDLKPENVMVIQDGDGGERVKIVDFGIAKALGDQSGKTALTRTGFVVGTPDFMSPEQLLGGELDARSDIYALALVAYQCLTGELPFASNGTDFGMAARLVTPPRPLTAVQPSVRWPAEVQGVFDQALSRDPADRPASAGAFARALLSAIDLWQAPPATPSTAAWATGSRTGTSTAVQSAFGTYAPPAPMATAAAPMATAPAPTTTTPATTRSGRTAALVGVVVAVLAALVGGGAYVLRAPTLTSTLTSTAQVNGASEGANKGASKGASEGAPEGGTKGAATGGSLAGARRAVAPAASANRPSADRPSADRPGAVDGGARRVLDSLASSYDPEKVTDVDAAARRAIGAIGALLPRLASADDSSLAEVRIAEAHLVMSNPEPGPACAAIRRARTFASTDRARNLADRYDQQLGCGGR